ncbi:hypothetical protein HanRHA438_Chr02g0054451 [Helianthus annuus]|nr:hypothetical protein HanRHA438_Chr02g0054451 [Helianthus annuus]
MSVRFLTTALVVNDHGPWSCLQLLFSGSHLLRSSARPRGAPPRPRGHPSVIQKTKTDSKNNGGTARAELLQNLKN